MSTLTAGPGDGTLSLHTGVEGRAARLGHALTIELGQWSATAELDGDVLTSMELTASVSSLSVTEGSGGVKPLSDKDRTSIRDNALDSLKAGQHPEVTVRSTAVTSTLSGYDIAVQVSIAGVTRPAVLAVTVTPDGDRRHGVGSVELAQTEHGVAPYSAMMGGLKVRDRVEVRLDAVVSPPAG